MTRNDRRSSLVTAGLAFAIALALFGALALTTEWLYDTDSAYHLAVARHYLHDGIRSDFPWVRYGLLAQGFADKELLFHLYLVPFASADDPVAGGRLALALLGALISAAIALVASRLVGRWGVAVAIGLVVLAPEWDWRLVRLRPELLALFWLLLAADLAARRRFRWLGVVALLFALSYTAVQAILGLSVLWFVALALRDRERDFRLAAYPVAGALLGLLAHPHFPANLRIFWAQNVEYFRYRDLLDVGTEIRPDTTDVVLLANAGLWLALLFVLRSRTSGDPPSDDARRLATVTSTSAVVFGGLYLLMSRFSLYALPFLVLAALAELRRRGLRIDSRLPLAYGRTVPLAATLVLAVAAAAPTLAGQLALYRERTSVGPHGERRNDLAAFAAAMPAGARVASTWGDADLYLLFAPQGRYLNVLDPIFLFRGAPEAAAAERGIFSGVEPDVPRIASTALDSRFVAFGRATADRRLRARLGADPRVRRRYLGGHELYELVPADENEFFLAWETEETPGPVIAPPGEPFAGYVDLGRAPCTRLGRATTPEKTPTLVELASYGPARIAADGRRLATVESSGGAILGEGIEIELPPDTHRLSVESCPDPATGRNGFYLVRRAATPRS